MTTNFKVNGVDTDDLWVRKELFTNGGLWVWGLNNYTLIANSSGMLGDNSIVHRSSPVQTVARGANWKQVSCRLTHTVAIKDDGTLWSWGAGSNGQLGNNSTTARSSPVQTVAAGSNWKLVSAGAYHTAALKSDGTLWLWGYGGVGNLGHNLATSASSPVQTVAGGNNWKTVSCGWHHTAAIKSDGTLWTWGYNDAGQLGDGTKTHRSSPVQTVAGGTNWKAVACGAFHTMALKDDNTLWTWGINIVGGLGDGTVVDRSSPVQVLGNSTDWTSMLSAGLHNSAAIKNDGSLWVWGNNDYGQLGNSNQNNYSSPVQTLPQGKDWKKISAGHHHMLAIKTDGTLWAWGHNGDGGLGDNTTPHRSSPVQTITGGTNWKSVGAGIHNSFAIREDYF